MSVSVYIKGIVSYDEGLFKDMLELKVLCDKTGSEYPKKVLDFFNEYASSDWKNCGANGLKECIGSVSIKEAISGKGVEYGGSTIDLTKLPKEVTKIFVYMS